MPKLDINAPDGKILTIDVPEGTDPSKYDSIVDDVISDYKKNSGTSEKPGTLKSAALGAMSGIPGAETVVSGLESLSPNTTFAQAHQGLEEGKNAAWENHPVAYGAGKTAGIVGTGLALPATATLGGAAALGAGIGAVSGVDTASSLPEAGEAALKGAGTGAILGSFGHGISKGIEALPGMAKRGLASLGKETNVNDIESYLANPDAINNAPSKEAIANKVADLTGDVTKASGQLSERARGLLNPERGLMSVGTGISDVRVMIEGAKQQYMRDGVVKAGMEPAINALDQELARITDIAKANKGVINEETLRGIIDDLQGATKPNTFGNPDASAKQDALKTLGGRFNSLLRENNPAYADAMAPSAEAANLSSNLQDTFKIDKGEATDATATKLGNLLKEGKPETQDISDQLKNMTGTDIQELLKNSQTKERLNAPGTGEAGKVLLATLGFGLGKTTGVPYGGIAGAAAGRFAANAANGGSLAKYIMNMYLSGSETGVAKAISEGVYKFGPILINAAKAGGNQLAATHFVLATSDPEYQKVMEHAQNNLSGNQ